MLKARDIGEHHSFEIDLHILMQQQYDYMFIFYLNHWCPFFFIADSTNFGVKDTAACLCEEAFSQLLQKWGIDSLRQVNFIIPCYHFFIIIFFY